MNKYDNINFNINAQPIPRIYDDGYSQYETMNSLLDLVNTLITNSNLGADEIADLQNKKVSMEYYLNDLKNNRKLDENGNFTGSWHGVDHPVHVEGGIDSIVIQQGIDLSDIKTLKPSGLQDDTDVNTIQAMINTYKVVKLSEGTFYITKPINLKEDSASFIIGQGDEKTVLKVVPVNPNGVIESVILKGNGQTFGGYIDGLSIDCSLMSNHGIRITSAKQMRICNIKVKNSLNSFYCFGGDVTKAFYECHTFNLYGEYTSDNTPVNRPNYGLELLTGAHDSFYDEIVIKNVKISSVIDSEPCCNFYSRIHSYGYPSPDYSSQYTIITKGNSIITDCYLDSPSVAGIKFSGNGVSVVNPIYLNVSGNTNASVFEYDNNVDYISVFGTVLGSNPSSGMTHHFLGTKGTNLTILDREVKQFGGILDLNQSTYQNVRIRMNANAGSNAYIEGQTSGKTRWRYGKTSAIESGTNVGSDFAIERYDDSGNYLDTPFTIDRATGRLTYNKEVDVAGTYTQPFKLKNTYIWCDSTGMMWCRIGSLPASETDGQRISRLVGAPANSSTAGQWGDMAIDGNYLYIWTGSTVNKRVALTSW